MREVFPDELAHAHAATELAGNDAEAARIREGLEGQHVCPFCGDVTDGATTTCLRCTMENTTAARKATKSRIGPWYVLQNRNPAAPGMKWETLLSFVRKSRVKPHTIIRGPTTHQLWRFAAHVKGLSREFGVCYSCGGALDHAANLCPHCNRLQEPPINPDTLLEGGEIEPRLPIYKEISHSINHEEDEATANAALAPELIPGAAARLAEAQAEAREKADTLAREKAEALAREKEELERARQAAEHQRDLIRREHEAISRERDTISTDKETLERERLALAREREAIQRERDVTLSAAREAAALAAREREAAALERENAAHEREAATREREAAAAAAKERELAAAREREKSPVATTAWDVEPPLTGESAAAAYAAREREASAAAANAARERELSAVAATHEREMAALIARQREAAAAAKREHEAEVAARQREAAAALAREREALAAAIRERDALAARAREAAAAREREGPGGSGAARGREAAAAAPRERAAPGTPAPGREADAAPHEPGSDHTAPAANPHAAQDVSVWDFPDSGTGNTEPAAAATRNAPSTAAPRTERPSPAAAPSNPPPGPNLCARDGFLSAKDLAAAFKLNLAPAANYDRPASASTLPSDEPVSDMFAAFTNKPQPAPRAPRHGLRKVVLILVMLAAGVAIALYIQPGWRDQVMKLLGNAAPAANHLPPPILKQDAGDLPTSLSSDEHAPAAAPAVPLLPATRSASSIAPPATSPAPSAATATPIAAAPILRPSPAPATPDTAAHTPPTAPSSPSPAPSAMPSTPVIPAAPVVVTPPAPAAHPSTPVVPLDPKAEAKALYDKALDAEMRIDFAEAIRCYEQIKKLPREVWQSDLDLRLELARKQPVSK